VGASGVAFQEESLDGGSVCRWCFCRAGFMGPGGVGLRFLGWFAGMLFFEPCLAPPHCFAHRRGRQCLLALREGAIPTRKTLSFLS